MTKYRLDLELEFEGEGCENCPFCVCVCGEGDDMYCTASKDLEYVYAWDYDAVNPVLVVDYRRKKPDWCPLMLI